MIKSPCKVCKLWKKLFPKCFDNCKILDMCQTILADKLLPSNIKSDYDIRCSHSVGVKTGIVFKARRSFMD